MFNNQTIPVTRNQKERLIEKISWFWMPEPSLASLYFILFNGVLPAVIQCATEQYNINSVKLSVIS